MNERLELILQTSPFEEKVTRNGLQKNIRVVIKNSPFTVQLKMKKHDIDLNNVAFEAVLLYDNDTGGVVDEKEVDFTLATQQILQTPGGSGSGSSTSTTTFPTIINGAGAHLNGTSTTNNHSSNSGSSSSSGGGNSSIPQRMEFEEAFKHMMNAYVQLDPRQRAEKVRRVFRNTSARDSETLSELLDLFITEGVGGIGTIAPLPMSPNQNSPVSPTLIGQNQSQPTVITNPSQNNPFITSTTTTSTTQSNGFVERNNANTDPYPFFSTLPTSFDNEFGSFNSGNDFIPF
ncbi:putative transcriptional regulator [Heterostelium album PN500]|uniref:Putative transcriptional regulator n=1 Tax=Heterostelium pallidum (strain ATCC 26659 / Pp 5 / PN500) TaxID=670386 RepID=D3B9E6_HETP5|nr:putative transcriptional regulator [Heterostelium album PN500]EFA81858.1 putative transcriptional regulator [Heterostelium album PN500]|eukprot:XP_020433975.1 putative transcriptional regulator [Heterostelium album PN500]